MMVVLLFSCKQNDRKILDGSSQFMKTASHLGKSESPSIKSKPSELWKFKTNGEVISSPVIVDGVVYVGSNDKNMYAIDAHTGEAIWTFETGGAIPSTPAVSHGKVMFLSYDGFFYALNQEDGSLAWKFQTEEEVKYEVKDYFKGDFKPDFWDFYLSSPTTLKKNGLFRVQ